MRIWTPTASYKTKTYDYIWKLAEDTKIISRDTRVEDKIKIVKSSQNKKHRPVFTGYDYSVERSAVTMPYS